MGRGMGGMGPGAGGMGGFGGGFGGGAPAKAPFDCLQAGTRVKLQNLQKAAEKNGDMGVVESYDIKTGRHIVKNLEDGKQYKLKIDNLQQIVSGAKITGMQSTPKFNGEKGTIIGYIPSKGRYWFRFPRHINTKPAAVRPVNVILPPNTVVRITGLSKAPEMNGKYAKIVQFDQASGRYVVQIAPTKNVKLKLENVVASSNL
mmetsp:Transcript_28936/g.50896  ORF Transcript_28936/g.50896 Transcript_28936/m.50896 type:complete len:202 (+) Transcript_28936:3-608(+)